MATHCIVGDMGGQMEMATSTAMTTLATMHETDTPESATPNGGVDGAAAVPPDGGDDRELDGFEGDLDTVEAALEALDAEDLDTAETLVENLAADETPAPDADHG
jgi:hypothetical protein